MVEVVENPFYGKMLVLDGDVQSSLLDEFIYHEALVHPAALVAGGPKRALVLGGGEGATLRELYRYAMVEEVVMVDIDPEVIDVCRKYLPEWHRGAFDDPRTNLIIGDAGEVVPKLEGEFDVIISDLVEPFDMGPTYKLFTVSFFEKIKSLLSESGAFVLQASIMRLGNLLMHAAIHKTLKQVFPVVRSYAAYVGSFDVPWSFVIATRGEDPKRWSVTLVDEMLKSLGIEGLRFYDGETHLHMFNIPKYVREYLEREDIPILTEETRVNLPSKSGLLPHD